MKIEGIIFDFDGTLFSSMHIWRSLPVKVLEKNGIKTEDDVNKLIYNMNIREAAEFMVKRYGVSKTPKEILEETKDILKKAYNEEIQPKPGVIEFLDRMKSKGVKMCIATATERSLIEPALKCLNMEDYFVGILTCFEVGKSKEFPDIYNEALKLLNLPKDKVIIFEDAAYCIKTAKAEGYRVAGIFDDSEEDAEYVLNNTDIYVKSFNELRDLID